MTINPLHFCYASTANVEAYAAPSVVFIAGPNNRAHEAFQRAREAGAEVYAYLAIIARPDKPRGDLERAYYMGDPAHVPMWGKGRSSWPGTLMTDIRAGSEWADWNVEFISGLIRAGQVDGVFLDSLGCRAWGSRANWESWPQAEREEWTAGAVDIVRRLDSVRREINDEFKIVTNNIWIDRATNNDASIAEQYIDGVCIESPPLGAGPFHSAYAQRAFGDLSHRRVFVIADTEADALLWATRPGVTHVTAIYRAGGQTYQAAAPQIVPCTDIRLPELRAAYRRRQASIRELVEAKRLLGDRVDLLTTRIKAMAAYVAEQAEGVE